MLTAVVRRSVFGAVVRFLAREPVIVTWFCASLLAHLARAWFKTLIVFGFLGVVAVLSTVLWLLWDRIPLPLRTELAGDVSNVRPRPRSCWTRHQRVMAAGLFVVLHVCINLAL